jgi:pyruvate dehydrogenase E1 component
MSSWIAAATSYSAHGVPMLPFYVFYSMFGFQRVGDFIWAAADSRARGFLLGATAGRTTLVGRRAPAPGRLEPSRSPATVPSCRAYDPATATSSPRSFADGMRRMLEAQRGRLLLRHGAERELLQPAMPAGAEDGIRARHVPRAEERAGARAAARSGRSCAKRSPPRDAREEWNVGADVWSVTSFTELRATE